MKKQIVLFLLIVFTMSLYAKMNYQFRNDFLTVTYENVKKTESDIYKVIAFPSEKVSIKIISSDISTFDSKGNYIGKSSMDADNFIKLNSEFVMRELYGHQIKISNKINTKNGYSLLNSVTFKILPASEIKHITKISKAFLPAYKTLADNFNYSYLRNMVFSDPKELIISHSNLSQLIEVYKEWKKQKGTDVKVAYVEDIGTTNTDIKNYILSQYNGDFPADYLLIIGDVDGSFTVPAYYVTEENDVTDQIYTELIGNDYFPEMIVGRFSIDQTSEFTTMITKVISYEKQPYTDQTDWYKHVVVVAGNYSPSPPYPSTPVAVSQWMADNFRNHGFDDVDEIYYPPTYPGTSEIHSAISEGAAFVTYRGWGDANGWHFPEYHIGEGTEIGVIDLSNGYKLPVVTSIVCHTGDFANTYHDPCFGEAWLRAGTPTNPKGGVAFVGPSDLHTHTKFNNAIYSGFYKGVLDEDIFDFGAAVLRGKIELYNNFPLNQAPGGLVEFYFRVYNILSDPNLQMWTDIPTAITCDLPSSISLGTNNLTLSLPNLDGAIVTALKGNEIYSKATVRNGTANLYFTLETEGTLTITITHPNKIPFISQINITQEAVDLGLTSCQSDNPPIAGTSVNLDLTVKNFGTDTANNVVGTLSTNDEFITINTASQNFGSISAGESSTQTYQITISENCPNNHSATFELDLGSSTAKFEININSLVLSIVGFDTDSQTDYLIPGQTTQINFHLKNNGIFAINNLNIQASGTNPLTFQNNSYTISSIAPQETADMTFTVSVASDCYIGRSLGFNFVITDSENRSTTCWYHITAGNVTNTAPTGPDNFGYYAYDSYDTEYDLAPEYEWIEIDPSENGSGTLIQMEDDQVETIDLPFAFKFYGEQYSQISVCSNGWLSFVPTDEIDFINWNIPAALGPYAMVAPYWDDLIGEPTGNDEFAPMNISYYYDASNHKFIIEWNNCYSNYDDTSFEKFQVILFDPSHYSTPDGNGNILFNYHTINNPDANNNYATVGIENHLQNDGLLYTFASQYPASATELQNNLSILFTTIKPDNYTYSQNDMISLNKTRILGNYPNPFNPETAVSFVLSKDQKISIDIYNLKGEKVNTLINKYMQKGVHSVNWNGVNDRNKTVASGIYLMILKSNGKTISSHKAILLK